MDGNQTSLSEQHPCLPHGRSDAPHQRHGNQQPKQQRARFRYWYALGCQQGLSGFASTGRPSPWLQGNCPSKRLLTPGLPALTAAARAAPGYCRQCP